MSEPTGQPAGPTYNCRRCGHALGTQAVVGNAAVLHAGGLLLRNRSEVLCECCLHRTVWRRARKCPSAKAHTYYSLSLSLSLSLSREGI
jgi:hypothetical protein